jgi:putative spermidine/putrescine transport system ATP-binding protein
MTMADLVVVMGEGRVRQAGSPVEIYRRPSDAFVASFIGTTNLLPAKADRLGALVPGGRVAGLALPSDAATLSVRPEDIELVEPAGAPLRGHVTFIRDLGATIEVFIAADGTEIVAVETPRNRRDLKPGSEVGVVIHPDRSVVLKS